jgi:hypothetical protein
MIEAAVPSFQLSQLPAGWQSARLATRDKRPPKLDTRCQAEHGTINSRKIKIE